MIILFKRDIEKAPHTIAEGVAHAEREGSEVRYEVWDADEAFVRQLEPGETAEVLTNDLCQVAMWQGPVVEKPVDAHLLPAQEWAV